MAYLLASRVWLHAGGWVSTSTDLVATAQGWGFAVTRNTESTGPQVRLATASEADADYTSTCRLLHALHRKGALRIPATDRARHMAEQACAQAQGRLEPLIAIRKTAPGTWWLTLDATAFEYRSVVRHTLQWLEDNAGARRDIQLADLQSQLRLGIPLTSAVLKIIEYETHFHVLRSTPGAVRLSSTIARVCRDTLDKCIETVPTAYSVSVPGVFSVFAQKYSLPSADNVHPRRLAQLFRWHHPTLRIDQPSPAQLVIARSMTSATTAEGLASLLSEKGVRGVAQRELHNVIGHDSANRLQALTDQGTVVLRPDVSGRPRYYWLEALDPAYSFETGFVRAWHDHDPGNASVGTNAMARSLVERHLPYLDRRARLQCLEPPQAASSASYQTLNRLSRGTSPLPAKRGRRKKKKKKRTPPLAPYLSGKTIPKASPTDYGKHRKMPSL